MKAFLQKKVLVICITTSLFGLGHFIFLAYIKVHILKEGEIHE